MNPVTKYGGIVASIVLIAFGVGSVVTGLGARSDVRDALEQEQIVGTPDMDASIAGKPVDTGPKAKLFAEGMRRHTLKSTDGEVYSQMSRFLTPAGKPTDSEQAAAIDPKSGKPAENAARNIWVTETALATALNNSYFAEGVAKFAIVMGAALLLVGIGFLVLIMRGWETASAAETRRQRLARPTVAAA